MIEAGGAGRLRIHAAPPETLFVVELWGASSAAEARFASAVAPLPAPGRAAAAGDLRVLWWEPRTWLVRAPADRLQPLAAALAEAVGPDGAATEVSAAFGRLRVQGPQWRELMMSGGVFDAESPLFAPGCVAGTVLHHLPVRLDVIDAETVDAYVAPSYADDLLAHWAQAVADLASRL